MKAKIAELIGQIKEDSGLPARIKGDDHLVEDIGLDSISLISLILAVESEFGIEIDFETFNVEHLSSLERFTIFVSGLAPQ